ncbi:conserved hypothetical protein [Talaromyces stipitatus ATCC 10500]|uniref:Ubiquinone biosynthesis protein n=1 Tax=Talaromyces stipitatus (strain ATCC 10500 / CBS 375.48 / QM 6759 / NRRL 1006) TaxID=441959 RepID=B8M996_TALSN|nr:uncharacterized protein TSTA_114650 [Talaromyces stipitatus ATCC 10500]EED17656.1 conserved hypothetical protein [Talaromyces stipitatus ATCC 10500]
MATICGCRPGAKMIIATPNSWMSMATRSSSRFMGTRQYQTTRQSGCYRFSTRPSVSLPSSARSYHSRFHAPLPTDEYTNSQCTILSAALEHIPEHGFTKEALIKGARDMGFLDVSIQLFTRQEMDLVLYWLASRRGLLRAKVQNGLFDGKQMSIDEKIKALVIERLRMNSPIVHRWQDALALMSFPTNIPLSLSELHSLSSDILYLADDISVDSSWYSKRLALSAVYASAEVVMTRDSSHGFISTEKFVERRFQDSQAIGQKVSDVKSYMGFMAGTAVSLGRSWGLKI